MPTPPYRIGILDATSLRGKELATALRERSFAALPPRLFSSTRKETEARGRGLVAFDDEPALLEEFAPNALADLDVLFLAGSPQQAQAIWPDAKASSALIVDLTSGLEAEPEAALAGIEPSLPLDGAHLIVVAHPAAQALALLLERLASAAPLQIASATVFEPVSERDLPGLHELEQQTLRLLAAQSLPQAVFDAQVAFNLRGSLGDAAQLSIVALRTRIHRQTQALTVRSDSDTPLPLALEVLQAPLFHATVLSLYVRHVNPVPISTLAAALDSPWLAAATGSEYPDVVSAAGADAIQLGPLRAEAAGGAWLFATLDNLRRAAFSAVDAAQAALQEVQ